MTKFFTNTVKKWKVLAVLFALILVASVVVGVLFSFNKITENKDAKVVRVQVYGGTPVSSVVEEIDTVFDEELYNAVLVCESERKTEAKVGSTYQTEYVFLKDEDDEKLSAFRSAMETALAAKVQDAESSLYQADVKVVLEEQTVESHLTKGFVVRAIIAFVVGTVLVFGYSAIRFGLRQGLLTALGASLTTLLSVALALLTRIPVSMTVSSGFAFAFILGAILSALFFAEQQSAFKAPDNEGKDVEEIIYNNAPVKQAGLVSVGAFVAFLIVGGFACGNVAWTMVAGLVGVVCALTVSTLFLTGVYPVVKRKQLSEQEKRARYDYKLKNGQSEKQD